MNRIRYVLLVLLGGCSFGILSTFVKLAYSKGFSLADVTSAQAYFGAAILWLLLLAFRIGKSTKRRQSQSQSNNPGVSTVLKLILTGMASGCISLSYYKCVQQMPASIAIILLMQYTWISILLERLLFKIPITGRKWLFLLIVLIGTVLGSGIIGYTGDVHISVEGVAYGLLAGFFYAVFVLANGYVGNALPAVVKSSWVVFGVTLIIMAVFPPFAEIQRLMSTHALLDYMGAILQYGLLLGFFGMVLPPLLFAYAIPKVGVSLSSILGSVELPTAALCAYWILSENINGWQLAGILLILLAIVLVHFPDRKTAKDGEPERGAKPDLHRP